MSIFDPEKIARNKAIVDAMPDWKRGEPINELRLTEVEKLKAVNTQLLEALKIALIYINTSNVTYMGDKYEEQRKSQYEARQFVSAGKIEAAIQAAEVKGCQS